MSARSIGRIDARPGVEMHWNMLGTITIEQIYGCAGGDEDHQPMIVVHPDDVAEFVLLLQRVAANRNEMIDADRARLAAEGGPAV